MSGRTHYPNCRHRFTTRALVGLVAVTIVGTAWPAPAADVALIQDGVTRAVICAPARVMAPNEKEIEPNDAGRTENVFEYQRQQLRAAVNDLSHYLSKMSGARVEIVTGDAPAGLVPIHIGERAVEIFGNPQKPALFQQGFRVVVSPKGVGLLGESDLATSYAIYEVLDRLGCRWFMPSEMGECIPELKTIALPELDLSAAPGTLYRGIWQADADYKRRNRCGGFPLAASHALGSYLDQALLDQHPDWVAIYQGKPVPPLTKWTKTEIADAMAGVILASFDRGTYKWSASLSPEDGIAFDESEDPKFDAGDWDPQWNMNSLTDRLILLCNRVAERVTKKYPDVLFGTLAYVNYSRPPVREKVHPNVVPVIAPISYLRVHPVTDEGDPDGGVLRRSIEGWGKAAPMIGVYYYGWFLCEQSAPNPMITKWSVDVPFALEHGCQFFQPETTSNFETTMHALWLALRLTWNPALKPADVINEINTRFYGNAAAEMAAYWDYVDHAWVDTKEYCGGGHGHLQRFTPERMPKMRELLNAAKAKAKTREEKFRVKMADESLILFEKYMKMRRDLAEGRWMKLSTESLHWIGRSHAMAERYRAQYAFSARTYGAGGVWGNNDGVDFFTQWYKHEYDDANRIAKWYEVLTTPPLRPWRFAADADKKGESLGWAKPEFDDAQWRTTDPVVESWSTIGHHNYLGRMWYRATVELSVAKDKKTYLWIGATDGSAKVYVNGQHVPYVAPDGKKTEEFVGFMAPASWNITGALKDGANQVTVMCERRDLNEIGTGGIMGPVAVYRER
ncbi:DUF4838 domain-containing protein [bacterium]|nr:DUF4838 domain-containing protein [bacterium]